jgi:FkbM family methyltransferase
MLVVQKIRSLIAFDNWAELLLQRLFFRRNKLQVHRIAAMHILVDHRGADAGSIRTCIGTSLYRPFILAARLPRSVRVLDLGANVGGFSLLLASLGHQFERLVCVEMHPLTAERLRFNIKTNIHLASEVVNAAVCGHSRTINLELGHGSTGDNIYRGSPRGGTQYAIDGRTFDDIVNAYFDGPAPIDICKMDIEGAEDEVLAAPTSENQQLHRVRWLLIEMHHRASYAHLCEVLRNRGFEQVASDGKDQCGVRLFRNPSVDNIARSPQRYPGTFHEVLS